MAIRNVRAPRERPLGISQSEVCRVWGIHERVLNGLEEEGKLPRGLRLGNKVIYNRAAIEAVLGPPPVTSDRETTPEQLAS